MSIQRKIGFTDVARWIPHDSAAVSQKSNPVTRTGSSKMLLALNHLIEVKKDWVKAWKIYDDKSKTIDHYSEDWSSFQTSEVQQKHVCLWICFSKNTTEQNQFVQYVSHIYIYIYNNPKKSLVLSNGNINNGHWCPMRLILLPSATAAVAGAQRPFRRSTWRWKLQALNQKNGPRKMNNNFIDFGNWIDDVEEHEQPETQMISQKKVFGHNTSAAEVWLTPEACGMEKAITAGIVYMKKWDKNTWLVILP